MAIRQQYANLKPALRIDDFKYHDNSVIHPPDITDNGRYHFHLPYICVVNYGAKQWDSKVRTLSYKTIPYDKREQLLKDLCLEECNCHDPNFLLFGYSQEADAKIMELLEWIEVDQMYLIHSRELYESVRSSYLKRGMEEWRKFLEPETKILMEKEIAWSEELLQNGDFSKVV